MPLYRFRCRFHPEYEELVYATVAQLERAFDAFATRFAQLKKLLPG